MCQFCRSAAFMLTLLLFAQAWMVEALGQTQPTMPVFQEADGARTITRSFSESTFEWPLTLINNAGQASSPLTLTLGPITRADGHAGKPATLTPKDLQAELVIKPHAYASVTLQGELPEFTTYRSWIMVSAGESSQVYDLKLERQTFQLVFPAATNNRLELAISSRNIDVPITFKLADGQPELSQLQFAVSSFARLDGRAPDGETLKIVQPDQLGLKPGEFQTVHLTGTNLRPGKYWAGMSIRNPDSVQWMDVQLNYAESTQRVNLVPITNTSAVVWIWSASAQAQITVDETAGQFAQVYTPHLESLERIDSPTRPFNLADAPATFTTRASNPTTHLNASNPSSSLPNDERGLTTIAERSSRQWTVKLRNLGAANTKRNSRCLDQTCPKLPVSFRFRFVTRRILLCCPFCWASTLPS